MPNLAAHLAESACLYPDRTAVRGGGQVWTYAELDRVSGELARLLRLQGVQPDDPVALALPNSPGYVACWYAVLRTGAIARPLDPTLSAEQQAELIHACGARVVVAENRRSAPSSPEVTDITVGPRELDELRRSTDAAPPPEPRRRHGDIAAIVRTAGTTGPAKDVALSHGNLVSTATSVAHDVLELNTADVVLGCLPLHSAFGLSCALHPAIAAGASLTLTSASVGSIEAMLEQVVTAIERDEVSVVSAMSTLYPALLATEPGQIQAQRLRLCASVGAPLPIDVVRGIEDALGCTLLEGYGLAETAAATAFTAVAPSSPAGRPTASGPDASFPQRPPHRKPGSIGTPIAETEVALVDDAGASTPPGEVGEIVVRGAGVTPMPWGSPDPAAHAAGRGWLRTGDLARSDDEGDLIFVDRKVDVLASGGQPVYPSEVEELLFEHSAVAEAAVVAVTSSDGEPGVGAAVVPVAGATVQPAELYEFVRPRLEAASRPVRVWLVDALPKRPSGAIARHAVPPPSPGSAPTHPWVPPPQPPPTQHHPGTTQHAQEAVEGTQPGSPGPSGGPSQQPATPPLAPSAPADGVEDVPERPITGAEHPSAAAPSGAVRRLGTDAARPSPR